MNRTNEVLLDVYAERVRQEERYGHVNDKFRDGTGPLAQWLPGEAEGHLTATDIQEVFRLDYEKFEASAGLPTWMHLVREEVAEAFQESDPERLDEELIQVAALCVSWVERIRNRPR
jgi:hypothetical protein